MPVSVAIISFVMQSRRNLKIKEIKEDEKKEAKIKIEKM
jgi:hypothetical protein